MYIFIKKIHLKMLSVKWRSFCLNLIVLNPGVCVLLTEAAYMHYGYLIRVKWHESYGIYNHWPLNSLFNSLVELTPKKSSKLHSNPLGVESISESVTVFYHDVDEIFWPQPIRSLKLGHVTGQGSMSPTWVGRVSDPGKMAFIKSVKTWIILLYMWLHL